MLEIKHASFWDEVSHLQDASIDLVCTDPPYMTYASRGAGRVKEDVEIQGVFADKDFERFAHEVFRLLKWERHIYVYTQAGKPYTLTYNGLCAAGFRYNQTLVWTKINFTKTGNYYQTYPAQTELIIFAEKTQLGEGRRKLNGRVHSNLLSEFASVPSERMVHPTQKPVGLNRFLIERSTNEGELVFDPFLGSGSSAFACRGIGRSYLGYEIEEKYLKQIAFHLGVSMKGGIIRKETQGLSGSDTKSDPIERE